MVKEVVQNLGGMIFISISERMQARMKILLEDIFGEKNHVSSIIWKNKYSVSNDKLGITGQNEYIFVYTTDIKKININTDPLREEYIKTTYKNPDNDPNGVWRDGVQMWKHKNPDSCLYEVVSPSGISWKKKWNFTKASFDELVKKGQVWWGKDGDKCPTKKVYLKDTKGRGINNMWDGAEVGYTSNGTEDLKNILNIEADFLYPKPISLIKRILEISIKDKDELILDFFAGSSTTGQAVLEFSKENYYLKRTYFTKRKF